MALPYDRSTSQLMELTIKQRKKALKEHGIEFKEIKGSTIKGLDGLFALSPNALNENEMWIRVPITLKRLREWLGY
jgi:hypothetical protein